MKSRLFKPFLLSAALWMSFSSQTFALPKWIHECILPSTPKEAKTWATLLMEHFHFFTDGMQGETLNSPPVTVVTNLKEAIKAQIRGEKVVREECEKEFSSVADKNEREKRIRELFQKKIIKDFPEHIVFSDMFAKDLQKKFTQTLAQEFSSTRGEKTPEGFLNAQRHKSDVLQRFSQAFQDFKESLAQIASSSPTQTHDEAIYRKTESISDVLEERTTLLQQTTEAYKKSGGSKKDLKNWKETIKNYFSNTISDLIQFFNNKTFTKNEKCLAAAHLMEHTAFVLLNMQPLINALGCQNLDEKVDQQNSFVRLIKRQAKDVQDHYKGAIRREKEGEQGANF